MKQFFFLFFFQEIIHVKHGLHTSKKLSKSEIGKLLCAPFKGFVSFSIRNSKLAISTIWPVQNQKKKLPAEKKIFGGEA